MRPRIQKEKTDNFDYIEMRVLFVFKYISKAKTYKLEKMSMTNIVEKRLIYLIYIFKLII